MTIKLNLSLQEYPVFNTDTQSTTVEFKNKNFVFGKNGAGKSTLCKMISSQFANDYDVRIFSGFDNILDDKKLNAVVLGEENISAKKEIDSIDLKLMEHMEKKEDISNEIKSLEWNETYLEEGIEKSHLYISLKDNETLYHAKKSEVEEFFRSKAKELKEYKNPQITKTSYTKNDFMNDIKNSKLLDNLEKQRFEDILSDKSKQMIPRRTKTTVVDFSSLINEINDLLLYKIEQVSFIEEIQDSHERKEFAERGLKLHSANENCSFCGNEITEQRIEKLQSFISVSKVKEIQEKVNRKIEEVEQLLTRVEDIKELKLGEYYSSLKSEILSVNQEIKLRKTKYEYILKKMRDSLNDKAKSCFRIFEELDIKIPDDFEMIDTKINELIERNNNWTTNLDRNKNSAMEKLRLHYVGLKLKEKSDHKNKWRGYEVENYELDTLKESLERCKQDIVNKKAKLKGSSENVQKDTLVYVEQKIIELNSLKQEILQKTKSTFKLATSINKKLKNSGKTNFELDLVKGDGDIEHYQIKDQEGIRSIDKLSTGEKNIIGFLYFIECLSDPEKRSHKKKIIIFDDPMNSNDDTMQYLIINEIRKLYTDVYRNKFNSSKDYFICLTHNVHFYLNVQPPGNFTKPKLVDDKIVNLSKYDKNHFYRLEAGQIKHITSQKDDFSTHYDFLWIELKSLYNYDLLNSMLNSMRRIIETYTKFNKINPTVFYSNKEEHLKLFNVSSHSIDDHSMEIVGKNKEELLKLFKELFEQNNALDHFDTHWEVR